MKKLFVIVCLTTLFSANLNADTGSCKVPDCSGVIKDCNAALDKADKVISDQKATIDLQAKALQDTRSDETQLQVALQQQQDKDSSILRNPWFDGLLGVVAGVIVFSLVNK